MLSPTTPETTPTMAHRLEAHLRGFGSVLVAFSGGVDSSVVAKAAHLALGPGALAVTAKSESNTDDDLELCRRIAAEHGMAHEVIAYSELAIPNYAENPVNRCFFCKDALYLRLGALARERGIAHVLDGSNRDDTGDYRPGMRAVERHGVRSPLLELGLGKDDVRAMARHYGLPNYDKPASPCLSSRIPYGDPITREKLEQVARAEAFLRTLGFSVFRCRHHGDIARIEVPPGDFSRLLEARDSVVDHLRGLGFRWVVLDLAGFRSGGMNPRNPPKEGSPR